MVTRDKRYPCDRMLLIIVTLKPWGLPRFPSVCLFHSCFRFQQRMFLVPERLNAELFQQQLACLRWIMPDRGWGCWYYCKHFQLVIRLYTVETNNSRYCLNQYTSVLVNITERYTIARIRRIFDYTNRLLTKQKANYTNETKNKTWLSS
jgi:hypothetical protein